MNSLFLISDIKEKFSFFKSLHFFLCLLYFRERERERERENAHVSGGWAEGERESQAGSRLSVEPEVGLDPTTLGS